jgi:hypothetical protein
MSPRLAYPQYMPGLPSDPPVGGWFTGAVGGDGTVAGVTMVFGLCLQAFIKCWLGTALSLPAQADSGENPGRLLAQPTLYAESASLSDCHSNPWDVSRQVTLPLAYPRGHSHDTSPQNWRSLMEHHGASAGSFPRWSSFAFVEVPGIHIRLEDCWVQCHGASPAISGCAGDDL